MDERSLIKLAILKEVLKDESDPIARAVIDAKMQVLSYGMKPKNWVSPIATDDGTRINPVTGEIM